MSQTHPDRDDTFRSVAAWLIVITLAVTLGRIFGNERVTEPSMYPAPEGKPDAYRADDPDPPQRNWPTSRPDPSPMFSSNDRSRWATVKALVEDGTYVVGRRVEDPDAEKGYRDEGILFGSQYGTVDRAKNPDTGEYYSTKPPLFSTILAGEYWLLRELFGWSIDDDRWPVVSVILITVNVLPLAVYLLLLVRLLDRFSANRWAKLLVLATACFGSYITTFSVTLNNHTPAACLIMVALYAVLGTDTMTFLRAVIAGFCTSLAACLDLPSAACAAGLLLLLLVRSPKNALLGYLPAALIPVAAFFYTNYLAIGELTPVYQKFGTVWYEYEGSHWKREPGARGIDFADEPKDVYARNLTIGHHGVFSLTPVWLAALCGMILIILGNERRGPPKWLAWGTIGVTAILFAFYIWRTNNYGGFSSGPRWFFWVTPLWLLCLLPAGEWMSRSVVTRWLAYLLLGVSVFSASYPVHNPWRHPWLYQMHEYYNWLRY